jgi:L-aspartate oxidase
LYAQGGISAVLDDADSIEEHIADTVEVGAGLCDVEIIRLAANLGAESIGWLQKQGVEFTAAPATGSSGLHLTKEGGHSHRRVAHVADTTGEALELNLGQQARNRPNLHILENHIAIDLITLSTKGGTRNPRCVGAYLLDLEHDEVKSIAANSVVLATGGASKAYLYTSNPDVSTGDGIAIAWRAGCRVANMEFVQFHPTCLYHPDAKSFLISEAVRGEGGKLRLANGREFMHDYDERGELAPRDIVARAIDSEMKRYGVESVFLDISHKPADLIKSYFPAIYERCKSLGFDMTKEPIPVVPAAHYMCGGIMTDRHGQTDLDSLYAIGETAYTGLHGANRMASNSLLECLVFARQAAKHIAHRAVSSEFPHEIPHWDESRVTDSDEAVVVSHNWDELRRFMWDYVGIVRSSKRLERARRRILLLQHEIREYYSSFRITNDLLELRNLVEVSGLIVASARSRKESRGLHYNIDFPSLDPNQARPSILIPDRYKPRID